MPTTGRHQDVKQLDPPTLLINVIWRWRMATYDRILS